MANPIPMSLDTISFNGAADGNGTFWIVQNIMGWEGTPLRQSWHSKLGADGEVLGESNRAGRTVVLSGFVLATSQTNAWTAFNALETLMTTMLTTAKNFVVTEPAGAKTISCYCSDQMRIEWITDKRFRFQITIKAPNPVKT